MGAQKSVDDLNKVKLDQIIDKGTGTVSATEIVYLAEECYKTRSQNVDLDSLCFVILCNVNPAVSKASMELAGLNKISNYDPALVSDISMNSKRVLIYYEPTKATIKVTG